MAFICLPLPLLLIYCYLSLFPKRREQTNQQPHPPRMQMENVHDPVPPYRRNVEGSEQRFRNRQGSINLEGSGQHIQDEHSSTNVEGSEQHFRNRQGSTNLEGSGQHIQDEHSSTNVEGSEQHFRNRQGSTNLEGSGQHIQDEHSSTNVEGSGQDGHSFTNLEKSEQHAGDGHSSTNVIGSEHQTLHKSSSSKRSNNREKTDSLNRRFQSPTKENS